MFALYKGSYKFPAAKHSHLLWKERGRGPRRNSTLGTFLIMEILSLLLEVVLTQDPQLSGQEPSPFKKLPGKKYFSVREK